MLGAALLLVLAVVALRGCLRARQLSFSTALPDHDPFATGQASPDELDRFRMAARYSAEQGGLAVLVLRGDEVVFEEYQNGHAAARPLHLFSGTKSFCCALAVAAMADGKLRLDELAADTLVEWQKDPRKSQITVRQLLDLSSGLKGDFRGLTLDGLKKPEHQRIASKYRHALERPARHEPGQRFAYGSQHFAAFGELIRRKVDEDPLRYLQRRVFEPIGFRFAGWNTDRAGNPMLAYGAWTSARHWARYGALLRDGGTWQGKQVLPADKLALCHQPSAALPAYGLTLWLNRELPEETDLSGAPVQRLRMAAGRRPLDPEGPADLFAAAGAKDQRLYVIPSLDLVVVRLGNGSGSYADTHFLARLLRGELAERE